jgi:hypothetical protein
MSDVDGETLLSPEQLDGLKADNDPKHNHASAKSYTIDPRRALATTHDKPGCQRFFQNLEARAER